MEVAFETAEVSLLTASRFSSPLSALVTWVALRVCFVEGFCSGGSLLGVDAAGMSLNHDDLQPLSSSLAMTLVLRVDLRSLCCNIK